MSEKLYSFFYYALYCVDVQSKPETLRKLKINGLSSRWKKNFLEYSYDSFNRWWGLEDARASNFVSKGGAASLPVGQRSIIKACRFAHADAFKGQCRSKVKPKVKLLSTTSVPSKLFHIVFLELSADT